MRSAALIRQIEALPKDAFKPVTLDRAGTGRRPKVAEQSGHRDGAVVTASSSDGPTSLACGVVIVRSEDR